MRTLVLVASALLVGGTVEAQATGRTRTVERDARRVEERATEMRDRVIERVMVADSAMLNRATLGLMLGGSPTKRDTLGVFVEGVAENGPAERAGIYEGHRIAFVNSVDVRASAADAGDEYLSSVGQHRLMRAMRDVSAGSTVTLRVWTGSGYRDVQVTAARYADVFKGQRFGFFQGEGFSGMKTLAPELEGMHMSMPEMRHLELRPSEASRPKIRVAPAPRSPRKVITIVTPSVHVVPSVEATPRAISIPRLAPTVSGRRRYAI